MITTKQINAAIAKVPGWAGEVLARGRHSDYFYFAEGTAYKWPATMVYVSSLNHLTLQAWVESFESLLEDYLKGTK